MKRARLLFIALIAFWATLGIAQTPQLHGITLKWIASTSAGVAGYFVYRGTVSGGPYTKITPTVVTGLTYFDPVVDGNTYFYVLTALDNGVETGISNQASATALGPQGNPPTGLGATAQ